MPTEKTRVIEHLYSRHLQGEIADGLITSDQVIDAIRRTGAQLGSANPANFLKDIVRSENANSFWPDALKRDRITARQRYGARRVFQFIPYIEGQIEPFPDRFLPDGTINTYVVQSASIPFAARRLGRKEETWLTQVVVNLRIVESQLAIFSANRNRVRDITHLQMGMKTAPEIDAVFLASYGESEEPEAGSEMHVLVTCEAKQLGQRILEDQIREQVSKAMQITGSLENPKISGVIPMAIKVVTFDFQGVRENAVFIVEFDDISRDEFGDRWDPRRLGEQLYSMPLESRSKTVFRIQPPIAGLNR